jgi:hypothetical protein
VKVLNVNPSAILVTHASDQRIINYVSLQHSHGLLSPTQWDKSLQFQDDDSFFGSAPTSAVFTPNAGEKIHHTRQRTPQQWDMHLGRPLRVQDQLTPSLSRQPCVHLT